MSELLCPCGHLVFHESKEKGHGVNGCLHGWPVALDCDCTLDTAQALRAAQRRAAIEHLRSIVVERNSFKRPTVGWNRCDNKLWAAISAYRAVGILVR